MNAVTFKVPEVIYVVVGTDEQNHWTHASTDCENAKNIAKKESPYPGDLRAVRYRIDREGES